MLEEAMERGPKIHNFVIDLIFFSFFLYPTNTMYVAERRELAVGKNLSIKKKEWVSALWDLWSSERDQRCQI